MKKFFATALLASGLIGTQSYGKTYYATNATPFTATVTFVFTVTESKKINLKPGQTAGISSDGYLSAVQADVNITDSANIGDLVYRSNEMSRTVSQTEMGQSGKMETGVWYKTEMGYTEASAYKGLKAGSKNYEHFFVTGPVNRAPHYRVGRLVQVE